MDWIRWVIIYSNESFIVFAIVQQVINKRYHNMVQGSMVEEVVSFILFMKRIYPKSTMEQKQYTFIH